MGCGVPASCPSWGYFNYLSVGKFDRSLSVAALWLKVVSLARPKNASQTLGTSVKTLLEGE